ncbi:hypothetical protein ACFVRD_15880 [Streptomyces sp. NPDC057908]|uniref:hypothetical protein n=1 Tax=Streptomyces sp. NPDC057908 TaxID=3346276 RepID=UPI0036E035D1
MKRMMGVTGLAIVTLCVTGCSGNGNPPENRASESPTEARSDPARSTPGGTPAPATSTSAPAPEPDTVLVTFTESGGIDGRHNSLVIYGDGRYLAVTPKRKNRSGRMKSGDLAELRAALDEVDFSRLPSRPTGPTVFDGITRVIVHDGHTAVDNGGVSSAGALAEVYKALPPIP